NTRRPRRRWTRSRSSRRVESAGRRGAGRRRGYDQLSPGGSRPPPGVHTRMEASTSRPTRLLAYAGRLALTVPGATLVPARGRRRRGGGAADGGANRRAPRGGRAGGPRGRPGRAPAGAAVYDRLAAGAAGPGRRHVRGVRRAGRGAGHLPVLRDPGEGPRR